MDTNTRLQAEAHESLEGPATPSLYSSSTNVQPQVMDVHVPGATDAALARPQTVSEPQRPVLAATKSLSRRSLVVALAVVLCTGLAIAIFARTGDKNGRIDEIRNQDISLRNGTKSSPIAGLQSDKQSLVVQGGLVAKEGLRLASPAGGGTVIQVNSTTQSHQLTLPAASGTVCLDSNNCQYATQGQLAQLTIPAATLLNGATGNITLQGTVNQISISTNGRTITLTTPQDLAQLSSPTFAGMLLTSNLNVSGVITAGSMNWATLANYPAACAADQAITQLGDSITCQTFATTSGSGNYIQNQFAVDQLASFRISGNGAISGLLGVGTNAPGAQLHVRGAGGGSSLFRVTDTTATARDVVDVADGGAVTLRNQTDTTAAFRVQNAAGTTILNSDTTTGQLTVTGTNTNAVAGPNLITTSNFTNGVWTSTGWSTTATTATHIVGNTNPLSTTQVSVLDGRQYLVTFTVSGNTNSGESLTPSIGGTNHTPVSGMTNSTYSYIITTTNSNNLQFIPTNNWNGVVSSVSVRLISQSNATVLRIDNGATINPALIDISDTVVINRDGATNMNKSSAINIVVASDDAVSGIFKGTKARGTSANPTVPLQGDYVVRLVGDIYDGTSHLGTALVAGIVDGPVSPDVAPQRIGIFTSPTNGLNRVERLTVSSNGNVGIGTTTPGAKLQVVGDTSAAVGTGTISSSGTTVTGSGTAFTTELRVGDTILVGTAVKTVVTIASNTSLTTNTAFSPALAGAAFSYLRPALFVSSASASTTGDNSGSIMHLQVSPASSGTANYVGSQSNVTYAPTGAFTANRIIGAQGVANNNAATAGANVTSLYGLWGQADLSNAGGVTNLIGAQGLANVRLGATGNVTNAIALNTAVQNFSATSVVSNAYGLRVVSPSNSGLAIPTVYGINIQNQGLTGSTNSYGLYVNSQSGATNSYAAVFAGGNVGIGTAAPTELLHVNGNTLVSGTLTVTTAVFNGTITVNGHIKTGNTAGSTTIAAGAAACTTPTVAVSGNDTAGTITVTTGTGCAATGTLATISFSGAYTTAPRVTLTAGNVAAAGLQYYRGSSTGSFTLNTNTTPTDSTVYEYDYHVLE